MHHAKVAETSSQAKTLMERCFLHVIIRGYGTLLYSTVLLCALQFNSGSSLRVGRLILSTFFDVFCTSDGLKRLPVGPVS